MGRKRGSTNRKTSLVLSVNNSVQFALKVKYLCPCLVSSAQSAGIHWRLLPAHWLCYSSHGQVSVPGGTEPPAPSLSLGISTEGLAAALLGASEERRHGAWETPGVFTTR